MSLSKPETEEKVSGFLITKYPEKCAGGTFCRIMDLPIIKLFNRPGEKFRGACPVFFV